MLILSNWVDNTALYPPAYIYAGMAKGKAEKQAEAICEELYKFTWGDKKNVLGELREIWRHASILCKLNYDGSVKREVIEKTFDKLQEALIEANNKLVETFKKHQDLNKWYKDHLQVSNAQLKEAVYTYKQAQLCIIEAREILWKS
ncbi:hypothetical protein [Erwinia phage COW86c]